ncbi:hypothetical protein [Polaromonas sp. YR568]|uniref:hypothetical protein n=1 Tax=Polaromonas sp. YR568 TaxID=1855301 RepID=UPI003137FA04
MSYYLSPIGNSQIIDANGDPMVGGTISTFLAGTSTTSTTYTDDTGGTSQGVVMTLNSLGYPTNGPVWMLGGVPLKFIIKNAAGVTQSTFDDISGIGDTATTTDQWVLYGAAPTYISATSFSVAGDQTNKFQVGRRITSTNSGGTIDSTITASVFGALTTVTVTNDSGVLDSGMSDVSYGLISPLNSSIPAIILGHPVGKMIAQVQTLATGALATGTTVIPFDDTIPQNTEGDQYMSLAITPQNASSTLEIDVVIYISSGSAVGQSIAALFQDSTAGALKAMASQQFASGQPAPIVFKHVMTAGTTSATTFKVRAGPPSAATMTFNGSAGARQFGGVMASSITIKEYLP